MRRARFGVCSRACCPTNAPPTYRRRARGRLRHGARAAREQEGDAAGHARRGARQQDADRLGALRAAGAEVHRPARVQELRPRRDLAKYIDWGPFFQTWDLAGPYPAILNDEIVGESARRVFADGKRMLARIIEGRWLTANGVVGCCPANTVNDDDIEIYTDESRTRGRADLARPAPAERAAGRRRRDAAQPLPRRFHRAEGLGRGRLHRPVRGDGRPRRRQEGAAVRSRPRRLQRDHAEGAGRPARRSLRRSAAPARAHASCGATRPTRRSTTPS